jgi:hypothetical protein
MDHVHVVSAGARLGHRALQHLVGAGAPDVHLDAVLLLERPEDDRQVLLGDGRVEGDRALLLRRGRDLLEAIRALVVGHPLRGYRQRECRRHGEKSSADRVHALTPGG